MSQLSVLALPDKFTRATTKVAGPVPAEHNSTYDVDDIVMSLQRRMSLGTNEGMVGRPVTARERGSRIFGLGDKDKRQSILGPARLGHQHACQGAPPREVTNWGWALGLVLCVSLAANILCTAVVVLLALPGRDAPLHRLAIGV